MAAVITYFLNCMGPINKKWIEEHGIDWYSGRIDIRGLDDTDYYDGRHEYGIRPMRRKCWGMLGQWLQQQRDEALPSLRELIEDFEEETGHEIEWLEVPKWKIK